MAEPTADTYIKEAILLLQVAAIALQRQWPDYGEAEKHIARAKSCIEYARLINVGKFRGEEF